MSVAEFLNIEELLALGFSQVGRNPKVSRDARFFAVNGTLGDEVRIDAFAVLTGSLRLGARVHISPFCFLGGTGAEIVMEDESGLSTHVSIFTKSDDYTTISHGASKISGAVHIGRGAILGAGSVVMPKVSIGAGAKIGSSCVVDRDIPESVLVVSRGLGLVPLSQGS